MRCGDPRRSPQLPEYGTVRGCASGRGYCSIGYSRDLALVLEAIIGDAIYPGNPRGGAHTAGAAV